ncbi:hypothetical protein BMS3Abin06_00090 [bacterium BMS3Abin06]|nr:hypothetical protein BMS3Abin06_00090 [bacterium BMS3Abin06]
MKRLKSKLLEAYSFPASGFFKGILMIPSELLPMTELNIIRG